MSRIGKKIISIPEKVTVEINNGEVFVKGPKGELRQNIPAGVSVSSGSDGVKVEMSASNGKVNRALWGTMRSLIANMVKGVVDGYEKILEMEGIGYKAQLQGNDLVFSLGFAHTVPFKAPPGIVFKLEKNSIIISGVDKCLVGEVAASIRKLKKPEPYKGKGIRYRGEVVRRKAGKKATSTSTA